MKLYVGNLPYTIDEEALRDRFTPYGTPTSVAVITDRGSGRSKGFGFVEFGAEAEGKAAIAALNGRDFNGRALTVSEARPRTEASGNRSAGGGSRARYGRGGGRY